MSAIKEYINKLSQRFKKWLKDRKGRELTFEDIVHYQKIIVALTETDRLMKEIDEINFIG
jgi:molybdopterin converting factor small subunit